MADVYINDAFGTSHRAHASTYGVAQFFKKDKYCGLLLEKEISKIDLSNVDGLFVSCTALKIVDVLDRVESSQNTIVISSNQAIIWDCLRSIGIDSKIEGYGELLSS